MRTAVADLGLERLDVVYAGSREFPLADRVRAVPLRFVLDSLSPLDAKSR
jgi:hypothetical protein